MSCGGCNNELKSILKGLEYYDPGMSDHSLTRAVVCSKCNENEDNFCGGINYIPKLISKKNRCVH